MKECPKCKRRHLLYAGTTFLFFFAQEFEQWCDRNLTDKELNSIRSIPLIKWPLNTYTQVMEMVNG
jgi:hypothetical protein